jgi:hypothetical protein
MCSSYEFVPCPASQCKIRDLLSEKEVIALLLNALFIN